MMKNRGLANRFKAAAFVLTCSVLMIGTTIYDGLVYLK